MTIDTLISRALWQLFPLAFRTVSSEKAFIATAMPAITSSSLPTGTLMPASFVTRTPGTARHHGPYAHQDDEKEQPAEDDLVDFDLIGA